MAILSALLAGFTLGLSLILAIGAQNAFVLKQGLQRTHVFWICLCCAFSDALLISAGVAGFGTLVEKYPQIESLARIGGALFLCAYGLKSFYSALTKGKGLVAADGDSPSLPSSIALALGFTWLNPHVYLDTVVLLGSLSTQYQPFTYYFGLGAVIASFVFFFSLGYGARMLQPLFRKPEAWQALDVLIGIVMLSIAYSLL